MKAVTVSVGFDDLLALALPRAARHFREILVVTTPEDVATQAVVARTISARCHLTRVFTARSARFNKGAALEEGFDALGRDGWFVVLDADIILPEAIRWPALEVGVLYSPLRRMAPWPLPGGALPPDGEWTARYPLHPQQHEWAGFFQLAHADDPALRERPWYPTDFTHAGTCDSLYQARWPASRKVRLPFEVLHLGEAGRNWLGRATPRADGTVPEGSAERQAELRQLIRRRVPGPGRYDHERLPPGGAG